jgi:hypothetical protein
VTSRGLYTDEHAEFERLWRQMLADSATESAAEIAADPDSEPL